MGFLEPIFTVLSANSTLVLIVTVLGVAVGGVALFLDYRNDRRANDTCGIERRRLSEVNLKVKHNVRLIRVREKRQKQEPAGQQEQGAFMVLRMPLKSIGDGPIDILGMLASARTLTYEQWENGIGARSRDVEWSDYHTS